MSGFPLVFIWKLLQKSYCDVPLVDAVATDQSGSGEVVRRCSSTSIGMVRPNLERTGSQNLAHLVYAKLIAPFSTVICFFAEDFGGLQAIAEILATWLMSFSSRASDLPPSTNPRVLVLIRHEDYLNFDEQAVTKRFMMDLGREAENKNGIMTGQLSGRLKKAKLDELLQQQFGGMRVVAFHQTHR
jgi:hypothetical protein